MYCFAALALTTVPLGGQGAKRRAHRPSTTTPRNGGHAALCPPYGSGDRLPIAHTGSAIEYFTWLNAKLDSIEAIPSSRVSLFFRNAS